MAEISPKPVMLRRSAKLWASAASALMSERLPPGLDPGVAHRGRDGCDLLVQPRQVRGNGGRDRGRGKACLLPVEFLHAASLERVAAPDLPGLDPGSRSSRKLDSGGVQAGGRWARQKRAISAASSLSVLLRATPGSSPGAEGSLALAPRIKSAGRLPP